MTVSTILMQKLSAVLSAEEGDGFQVLAEKLAAHGVGALVILDKEGGLAGILSERDLVRAVASRGADVFEDCARDMMTRDVYVCQPHDTELQVMKYMLDKRIRHLPVIEEGKVVGMVSLGDAVKSRLLEIGQILLDSGMEGKKGHGSFTKHLRSKIMPKG